MRRKSSAVWMAWTRAAMTSVGRGKGEEVERGRRVGKRFSTVSLDSGSVMIAHLADR